MSQPLRLAFMGFRHGHVLQLYKAALKHPGVKIVAACEEHSETAEATRKAGIVNLTHTNFDQMLKEVECDAIGIGDYFGRRGSIIIKALQNGKHAISDKPICTDLKELDEIEKLAAQKKLSVGCMFELRDFGPIQTMRRLIKEGKIGEIQTINFTAQHPLLPATRARWYFEPGKQGGTINDIAIHAIDLIPWMTGRKLTEVVAARVWHGAMPVEGSPEARELLSSANFKNFQNGAQFMLKMDNNGGVLGDVSYFAPNGFGYQVPQYWRMTFHGTNGVVEARYGGNDVILVTHDDKQVNVLPSDAAKEGQVLEDFLFEIHGGKDADRITTKSTIEYSRQTLKIQKAADEGKANMAL